MYIVHILLQLQDKEVDCLKKTLEYLAFIDQNIFAMSTDYGKLLFTHNLAKRYPNQF